MAKTLNVEVGDRIRAISPILEVLTPMGPAPKSAGFRVAAIFSTKMYEYDSRYVYMTLPAARRFFELQPDFVSGLHLRCDSPDHTDKISRVLRGTDAIHDFEVLDWRLRNQTLFSALKLEKVVAFVVLVFIILVASFSIVNTLTMSVIEKRREIAILKTMGARDVGIMKVFVVQGLLVGTFGTLCGALLGVGTMKSLETLWLLDSGRSLLYRLPTREVGHGRCGLGAAGGPADRMGFCGVPGPAGVGVGAG